MASVIDGEKDGHQGRRFTTEVQRLLLDWVVGRTIRQQLGLDKARMLSCGAAPVHPGLLRWFHAIGLPSAEGYGQTEVSLCTPLGTQDESVDNEWSFAQTLRHLVLATDGWLGRAILRRERPFLPLGVLFSEASAARPSSGSPPKLRRRTRRCSTRAPGVWRWCAITSAPSLRRSSRPREPTRGAASGSRASSTASG